MGCTAGTGTQFFLFAFLSSQKASSGQWSKPDAGDIRPRCHHNRISLFQRVDQLLLESVRQALQFLRVHAFVYGNECRTMSVGILAEINPLNGSDDDCGRPAKHHNAVNGFKRRQEAAAAVKNHIALSQRGEGDRRKIDRLLESFDDIECQIRSRPYQYLCDSDEVHDQHHTPYAEHAT